MIISFSFERNSSTNNCFKYEQSVHVSFIFIAKYIAGTPGIQRFELPRLSSFRPISLIKSVS